MSDIVTTYVTLCLFVTLLSPPLLSHNHLLLFSCHLHLFYTHKVTTLPHLSVCHHFCQLLLLSCNWRGRQTCHTLSLFSCHLCPVCPTRQPKLSHLSLSCRFLASFYRHLTNIVAQFITSVILSYHLVAVMWPVICLTLPHLSVCHSFVNIFCCHVTDVVVKLVTHCHCLVVICVRFAQQGNQNCHTLSLSYRFVAPFYRHLTNIVAQFITSVVHSYHLVAVMWPVICPTLPHLSVCHSFVNIFCCHVTDVLVKLVTHCRCLVVICVWFAQQRNQKLSHFVTFLPFSCIFLPSFN